MRVLYGYKAFSLQRYGGVSRYFCELIDRISRYDDVDPILALRLSRNENLRGKEAISPLWSRRSQFLSTERVAPLLERIPRIDSVIESLNRNETLRIIRSKEFDVFHPTYYSPYFIGALGGKPFAITVYDMIHERFPDHFPDDTHTIAMKRNAISEADAIIAISESTKRDIVEFIDVDPGDITVIHLGNPLDRAPSNKASPLSSFPGRYLLFVGNRRGYKNFRFLLESLSDILREDDGLHLVCAGGPPLDQDEMDRIQRMGLRSKVHHFVIHDDVLRHLYANAEAFVFPSLYEGFGLPVLEAFSQGCPAILSDGGSLPEVGGPAACYFDPTDPRSLVECVGRTLSEEGHRRNMIERGHERLRQFSWDTTALKTKRVYEGLL